MPRQLKLTWHAVHLPTTIILIALAFSLLNGCTAPMSGDNTSHTVPPSTMLLTSPAFAADQMIPADYTCDATNVSMPLTIADVPAGTKSFALIMHDPDAPVGDFLHWILWNIPPDTRSFAPSVPPAGATEGLNGTKKPGYFGPCPPSGAHHYHFDLYALDTTLNLSPSATREELLKAMAGHELARTTLIGLYQRQTH